MRDSAEGVNRPSPPFHCLSSGTVKGFWLISADRSTGAYIDASPIARETKEVLMLIDEEFIEMSIRVDAQR
jgi:hypothetical protein